MGESIAPVRILNDSVARKIAAGEVIERPQAVVRELLDNSLDANARHVSVDLIDGGNALVRVADDGVGMEIGDLELCTMSHATSKISSENDLLSISTLGFRGEALSSIAAVSRLTVTSGRGGVTGTLRVEGGHPQPVRRSAGRDGTVVEVADLFYNLPARKQFLKRPQTEGTLCHAVFRDKALGFCDVEFRLSANDELRSILPKANRIARIAAAYPEATEPSLLHELHGSGDGFSFTLVASEPAAHRRDRKHIQLFVNSRRIWEYALVQAVEYAYADYLHGGLHPAAYLFLEIDPSLVDVNVHPAKREIKFRNISDIHRRVVETLKRYLGAFDVRTRSADPTGTELPLAGGGVTYDLERVFDLDRSTAAHSHATVSEVPLPASDDTRAGAERPGQPTPYRYLGQVMGVFLVVEVAGSLFLVDQHAAHERIIYDRLRRGCEGQELLFPVHLDLDRSQREVIEQNREELDRLGIGIEFEGGACEIVRSPSEVNLGAEELAVLLIDLLDRPDDFARELFASISCHAAVTDGDDLADQAAHEIIRGVLPLKNARCPHGRPIWMEITREQLFRAVGRA